MRILTAAPNYANAQTDQGWSVPQTSDAASALSTLTKIAAGNILDSISQYTSLHVEDLTRFFTGFSATSVNTNPRPNPTQSSQEYLFIDEVAGFQSGQTVSILEGYGGNYSPDSFVGERFFPKSVGVIPMTDSAQPSRIPYPDTLGNGTPITLSMPVPPETPAKHIQRLYSDYKLSSGYYTSSAWTFTATTDGTTAVLTNVSSTANLVAGQSVSGTGISTGATIISVDSANQITISANTTASGSTTVTTPNTVVTLPNSDGLNFTVGQTLTDSYANYIGVITAVSSGFLTLSTAPTTNSTTTATQSSTTSLKNAAQITAAVASSDGTSITYTANNNFAAGDVVTILNSSSSSASFNFVNIPVITATSTSFTISGSVSGSLTGWTGIATLGYTQYSIANPYLLYASGSPITVSSATPTSYNYTSTISTQDYISVSVSTTALITSAVGNGTTITYTAQNSFVAGQTVSIVGLSNDLGASLNLTNVVIASTDGTKFTVTNSTVGTSNGGGTAYIVSVYGAVSGANLSIVDYSHEIAATSLGYEATYTRGYIDSTGFINTPTTTNNMQVGDYVLDTIFTNIGQVTASAVTGATFTSQFQNPTITGYITASYGSSAHAVTSITAGGVSPNYYATLVTGTAHGRSVGDLISFAGVSAYTGVYTVVAVTNATTLVFSSTAPTTTVGAGGTQINAVTALTVSSTSGIQVGMTFGTIGGFLAQSTVVGVDSANSRIYINTGAQGSYTYASPGQAFSITTPSSLQGKLITGTNATAQNPMNLLNGSYTPVLNQTITGTGVPTSTTLVGLPTTANKVTAVRPTYAITSITYNASPYNQAWCLVTTSVAHPFFVGQQVTLSGGTYINGTYTISSVPSSTSFNISKTTYGAITTVSSASGGTLGYTWTYTANNNLQAGDHITVTGTTNFNVTNVQVVSATATQFTITRATNSSGGTLTGQWNLANDGSSNLSTGGASVAFAGDTSYFTISNAFTGTLSSNVVLNIADGTSTTVDTNGGLYSPTSSTLLVFQSSGFPYFILDGTKMSSPSFYGQIIGFPWRGALNTTTPSAFWQAKFTNFAKTPAANLVKATTSQSGPSTFYVDSTGGISGTAALLFRNDRYTVVAVSSSYNIVGASSTGSAVIYTTDTDHNLSSGQLITVSGITPTTLNLSNVAIVSVTSNTFTVASTVTDTYVGGGVVDVAQPYVTVNEASPAYSLATTAYSNGDYAQNSFFNYNTYQNTISGGCMLTDTQYQGTGLGSLYSTSFQFSNKHVAGTAVGSWLTGNRYFGSSTTGDLEIVSPTWLGSLTGGTLFSDLVAQSSQAFIVSPAAISNSTYSNSGTITPISNFVNFSVSGYGNNVVIVGEGENQEAVLIDGSYQTIDGSDITQANAGAVLWSLAEGQSFQYNHSAGEPVVLPNVIGNFSNNHGKNAPVIGGADRGSVASNGVLTAGALVASNPSGKTTLTTNASMNLAQPWYQSGVSGQPNINTTLTYSATVGSGSITIDDANDFPTSYPSVYNQNADSTKTAIGFFLGSFGRVAGNTPIGSTQISINVTSGFQQPIALSGTSNFQIVINGDTLTCSSILNDTSTYVFTLTSPTTKAYPDLSPALLAVLDTSSTITSLAVPYFYPTVGLTVGKPVTSLTTTPTPIALTAGLNLYLTYGTVSATITVAQDTSAGSTVIPIQYFKPSHNFPAVSGSNGVITTYNTSVTVGLNIPLNANDIVLLTSGDGTATQALTVTAYTPEMVTSFPVKPFNPNYAYDNTAQIQYLYPLVLDSGAVQETVYPIALPYSTSNITAGTPPFVLPIAFPTVYNHSAGATLEWYEFPTNPANGDVAYRPDLDKFYIFDGNGWEYARIHNVQNVYSVLGATSSSYKDKEIFTLVDPVTGAVGTADSFSNNSPASYTVNVGNVRLTDPNGNEWSASALQNILLNAQVTVPQSTSVALRAIAMQITFRGGPSVAGIYLSPSDILEISDSTNPYIGWTYADVEGDPQTGWDVRIFDDFTYQNSAFDPNSSTPIWEKSANNDTSSVFLTSDGFTGTKRFISGEFYWVFVRVSKDFHQKAWWSDWNSAYFATLVTQPQQPLVTAFTDSTNAVNHLAIQVSDNLLGDNNADFGSSVGGWHKGTNDTAGTSLYFGKTATNSRTSFTEGQLISSIPVGAFGYVSTVGALSTTTGTGTFSVSSVNGGTVKATGFPIGSTSPTSPPFWVTVQNADGTNAEQILVKNLSDGSKTKADTFKIILRNYNYSTGTGGTGLTHSKWSQVVYGLQQPIYSGSGGILSFTYDTTVLGTAVWKIVEPATGGTYSKTVTNSYNIVEGNDKHKNYVLIDDPNDSLPVGSSQSLDCQIQYSTWTVPAAKGYYTFNPAGSKQAVTFTQPKATQTTPTTAQSAEPAKITSVVAAMTSGGGDVRIGYLSQDHACGTDQHTGKVKKITHLKVTITNQTISNRPYSGDNPNAVLLYENGWHKGDIFKVFGHPFKADGTQDTSRTVAAIFTVASDFSGGSYAGGVSTWNIPVVPTVTCPMYTIPGTKMSAIPVGNMVHYVPAPRHASRKKVIFDKPLNQGQWAGQTVRKNDKLQFTTSKVVGGSAAQGQWFTPQKKVSHKTYQTFYVGLTQYYATYANAVIPSDPYTTLSIPLGTSSFTGTTTSGSATVSGISASLLSGLTIGMNVSGTGIPSSTTITYINNINNSITLSNKATASGTPTITTSVTSNAYQGWVISGVGMPAGAYVVSNTASSGGSFTVTLSNSCQQAATGYNGITGSFNLSSTVDVILYSPAAKKIPAGSTSIPVTPFYANFNYDAYCPIVITNPPIFGQNTATIDPSLSGTYASPLTAEISLAPASWNGWTATNSVPVYAGNTYGFGGFSKMIEGTRVPSTAGISTPDYPLFTPYIDWYDSYGNLIATSNGTRSLTKPLITGNITSGSNQLSNVSPISNVAVNQVISGIGIPSGTTVSSISGTIITMSANATASLTGINIYVHNNFTAGTKLNPVQDAATVLTDTTNVWGQGWCPAFIVANAPNNHVIAYAATTSSVTSSTAQLNFSVGLAHSISAGTPLTFNGTFNVITTTTTAQGATTMAVRFTAGTVPPSVGNITISASYASPRFQWVNALNTDAYSLSAVMFKAMQAPAPTSDYSPLNTSLATLQSSVVTGATNQPNNSALTIPSSTPTLGEASIYVIDPANDAGTREIHYGSGNSSLWTSLTSAANVGDTSIVLNSVEGLAANSALTVDFGSSQVEYVNISSTWNGSATVTLASPLWFSHKKGAQIYAATAGISGQVRQNQGSGTQVAVFNWNTDAWVNTANTHTSYKVLVERSEDQGQTWSSLRGGSQLKVNSSGFASLIDYEAIPNQITIYRVTPTYTTPAGKGVVGIRSAALQANTISNNSWWIASTSDDSIRFAINVLDGMDESQRHPAGTFYPLGSPYPLTVPGVVTGRDGSLKVMWTDPTTWEAFLAFLKRGEIFILLNPVENERRYIFVNQDVQIVHHAAVNPYREVTIPFVESAPPTYTYVN